MLFQETKGKHCTSRSLGRDLLVEIFSDAWRITLVLLETMQQRFYSRESYFRERRTWDAKECNQKEPYKAVGRNRKDKLQKRTK